MTFRRNRPLLDLEAIERELRETEDARRRLSGQRGRLITDLLLSLGETTHAPHYDLKTEPCIYCVEWERPQCVICRGRGKVTVPVGRSAELVTWRYKLGALP